MSAAERGVLVTGANGHLGRRLVRRLAREPGVRVRAVVRSERAAAVLESIPETERPETRVVDYADVAGLAQAAEDCRAAVHLVGILKEGSRTRYRDAHEGATGALLEAARKAGVERIVYLSIFGAGAASPNACLASKGRAEQMLLASGLAASVIRLPMVLGPDDFASRALRARARARVVPLVRGGATLEQPIDAEDVVAAILGALALTEPRGEILELGGPESLSHRALVQRAAALHGRRPRVLPIPLRVARGLARLAERLASDPPLTLAMLEVLEHDDCVDPGPACRRLGVRLTPLDDTLRRCVGPGSEA